MRKFLRTLFVIALCMNIIHPCPYMKHYENELLFQNSISDFDQFENLNFTSCNESIFINTLKLEPNHPKILNDSLNFNGLKLKSPSRLFNIVFSRIKGIESLSYCLKSLTFEENYTPISFIWYFTLTRFDFYIDNQLINRDTCKLRSFQMDHFMTQIQFIYLQRGIVYSDQTCPFIFDNSRIQVLSMDWLSSSFIQKNELAFMNITDTYHIQSDILQLILHLFHYNLTAKLLDENVFRRLNYLDITGIISSIQDGLFKSLKMLKMIRLKTQNAKGLLTVRNNWLNDLNNDVNIDLNENTINSDKFKDLAFLLVIFQTFSNVTFYDYPEKDFCLFKDFPHQRLVWPWLRPTYKAVCSCTELFLIQYSYQNNKNIYDPDHAVKDYYFLNEYYFEDVHEFFFSSCVNSSIKKFLLKCNFKKRLDQCRIKSINKSNDLDYETFWYVIDWQMLSKYSYISFVLYVNPALSFVCILFNIVLVRIFSHKKLKKEIRHFYSYLIFYLYSNIIFMLVHFSDLMIECTYVDYFCSVLKTTQATGYFKNIVLKLIYNSLTSFSNLAYSAFVLTRFIKITNTKNELLKKFEKLPLKFYLTATIIFSVLINMFVCFEYSMQFREAYSIETDTSTQVDYFKINLSQSEELILQIFQYMKIIFSDFFFFITSIILDVSLIIFIKKKSNRIRSATVTNLATVKQNNKSDKKESSKRRLTAMIVLNGLNFVFLRLPLAVIDFYGLFSSLSLVDHKLVYTPNLSGFIICRIFKFCENLKMIFYSMFLLSFLAQFFIFYKLDNNFNEGFKNLKADLGIKFRRCIIFK